VHLKALQSASSLTLDPGVRAKRGDIL